jgi:transcriptional regulator with XRE-family HTH domain
MFMKIDKAIINDRNKLKAMLVLCGVTMTDIAREKGVTQPTVSAIVAGRGRSFEIEQAIADKLGVSYEALWGKPTSRQLKLRKAA